jgi:hypothetical protein
MTDLAKTTTPDLAKTSGTSPPARAAYDAQHPGAAARRAARAARRAERDRKRVPIAWQSALAQWLHIPVAAPVKRWSKRSPAERREALEQKDLDRSSPTGRRPMMGRPPLRLTPDEVAWRAAYNEAYQHNYYLDNKAGTIAAKRAARKARQTPEELEAIEQRKAAYYAALRGGPARTYRKAKKPAAALAQWRA